VCYTQVARYFAPPFSRYVLSSFVLEKHGDMIYKGDPLKLTLTKREGVSDTSSFVSSHVVLWVIPIVLNLESPYESSVNVLELVPKVLVAVKGHVRQVPELDGRGSISIHGVFQVYLF